MNLKEIREILDLLKGSDVTEFELGRGETVLKVRRGAPPSALSPHAQPAAARWLPGPGGRALRAEARPRSPRTGDLSRSSGRSTGPGGRFRAVRRSGDAVV
jgi:hypothetical protein